MRSYTFSFKSIFQRKATSFARIALSVFFITILLFTSWELLWRFLGFVPTHSDTYGLWADKRAEASVQGKERIVLLGSSRVFYGINTYHLEKLTGKPTIQLAINGSSPLPQLEDLAHDKSFQGTVLCGITPFYFFNLTEFYWKSEAYSKFYQKRTIADQISHTLNFHLEKYFSYPSRKELALQKALDESMNWDREVSKGNFPKIPKGVTRQLSFIDKNRQAKTPAIISYSPTFLYEIRKRILSELNTLEVLQEEDLSKLFLRIKRAISTLQKRGSLVIFLRMPANDKYLLREKQNWPRKKYWDRLLQTSGAPGIHFQDFESLKNFKCPDYSHLTTQDSLQYTENLFEILHS
ncbi:MAG: hypothetical protein AAF518_28605, partial [Spirochaetota bacterium]